MSTIIYLLLLPIVALVVGAASIAHYVRGRMKYRGIDRRTGLELTKKINQK